MSVISKTPVPLVGVTVFHGDNSIDVAVPAGVAVAHLLSVLRIDPHEFGIKVSGLDGHPIGLDSVLGETVPSGSVLTVTGAAPQKRRSGVLSSLVQPDEETLVMTVPALLFIALVQVCAIGLPLALSSSLPWWLRLAGAAFTFVMTLLLCRRPLLGTTTGALLIPALLAAPFAALISPTAPTGVRLGVALAAGVGTTASFVIWALTRQAVAATSAALWGVTAFVAAVTLPTSARVTDVAPILLALGVAAVVLAPRLALPIPESQLVDLPLLTTSAPAVRQPNARPPARITSRRVRYTVRTAEIIAETCTLGGIAIAALASGFVALEADTGSLRGLGAIAELAAAVTLFGLLGRTHRSALMRIAPRAGAVLVAAIALTVTVLIGRLPASLVVIALSGLGLVLVWGALLVTREPRSALLGRVGDLVQGLALTLLVPAAIVAAGLFDIVREVAS
ncbi:MAG: hypothetical protein Q4B08_01165 [Propionibacteriaceae bacterium]|nr:hypothetical protein [Propionibacteriaceae bacterium]